MESVGERYIELADYYLKRFPVSKGYYKVKEFDAFGYKVGGEHRLPQLAESPKDSGWGTHLQNRHILKKKINAGGKCLLRNLEEMFQVESRRTNWRTTPLADHVVGLSRTLPYRSQRIMTTRMKAIYAITDKASLFPPGVQITFNRIAFWLGNAQEDYDIAGMKLVKYLNQSFDEIGQSLITLRNDGVDITECIKILKIAGIELDAPEELPKPIQITNQRKKR